MKRGEHMKKRVQLTPSAVEALKADYVAGMGIKALAAKYNIDKYSVRNWLMRLGLLAAGAPTTRADLVAATPQICADYASMDLWALKAKYKASVTTLYRILLSSGVAVRPSRAAFANPPKLNEGGQIVELHCSACRTYKAIECFNLDGKASTGRHSRCIECMRWQRRAAKFGLSKAQYTSLLSSQGGVCKICGTDKSGSPQYKDLVVDHDHATGRIRGLLCHHCNAMLGGAKDNKATLAAGIEYLNRNEEPRA